MDEASHDESDESLEEAHWCADCERELPAAEQQKAWEFCDFCGESICVDCDRTHACAPMLRKKPTNW